MLTSGTKAIGAFEIGRVLCVGCLYGAPDNDDKLDNCPGANPDRLVTGYP